MNILLSVCKDRKEAGFLGESARNAWLNLHLLLCMHLAPPFFLPADRQEMISYSGSDNEEEETTQPGEPSSIIQAPAGDTLRRNFMMIQVGGTKLDESGRDERKVILLYISRRG